MNDSETIWQQVNELLERALEQPEGAREDFVRTTASGKPEIVAQVLELLSHGRGDPLDTAHVAAGIESMIQDLGGNDSLIGLSIGPFVVTREIARGGMGQVFEAKRRNDDFEQTVAVKLLPGHRLDDEARLRFAVERRILAGLRHPNIAQLIDGGTLEDGMPYIVMEYVDGVDIDEYCRKQGLSNRAILKLILQVCSAVQHAHRNLIVHRDIKPSNVLIDDTGTPKLLDFGIAKMLDSDEDETGERTRTGVRLLTPAYASPEQIEGREVTTAVDVYALGLLTYKLLTDRLPYRAEPTDSHSMEQQILSAPPDAPSNALRSRESISDSSRPPEWRRQQCRALKGDLDTILLMALRKEPERRYANVAALAEDLQRHLDKRPIQARADSLSYRLGLLFKRHPVGVPVSALALIAALGAGTAFTWILAEERDQALAAEARALQTARFTASLLDFNVQRGDGNLVPVTELLDNASRRVAEELAEQPRSALPLHMALGEAYSGWGRFEDAMKQAEAALRLAEDEGLVQEQAMALDLLSRNRFNLGEPEEALRLSRLAFDLIRETASPEDRASMAQNLALMLNEAGRRLDAVPIFAEAEAAMRAKEGEMHDDLPWLLNNYGWCLHALGRYDEALPRYDEALALLEGLDWDFERALTLSNRAGLFFDTGRLDKALSGWEGALTILQEMYGEDGGDSPGVSRGHRLVATALTELGRLDDALDHSNRAVILTERTLGPEHPWMASAHSVRAQLQLALGDLDAAQRDIETAAAVIESSRGTEHLAYATIHLLRGRLALEEGLLEDAASALVKARAIAGPVADIERTPIDQVEWLLARVLAMQGQAEGPELARSVIERMGERLDESDWRLRIKQAAIQLPPFNLSPDSARLDHAHSMVAEVSELIGENAPRVRELRNAITEAE